MIELQKAEDYIPTLPKLNLVLTDPPYYRIAKSKWDKVWKTEDEYVDWLVNIFSLCYEQLEDGGSLIFFSGIGRHGEHPLFKVIVKLEQLGFTYRNWITWKKRRAYGKKKDYLFTREEVIWMTKGDIGCFNIPYLGEKRGYSGFNTKYPAKSEFKRVTNVWDDITEIFATAREAEKPVELMRRFVETHSNPNDIVLDCFAGLGATGRACQQTGRIFYGCDIDQEAVTLANERLNDGGSKISG